MIPNNNKFTINIQPICFRVLRLENYMLFLHKIAVTEHKPTI